MIVEERTYTLKPGTVWEYYKDYDPRGLEIQTRILGNLIGYFTTDVGHLNQVVHLWGYKSHDDRARRRARLLKSKEWNACADMLVPLIISQENRILLPTRFSPIR